MKRLSSLFILTALIAFLCTSCSREELSPPESAVFSKNGGTSSHNNGKLCLSCHIPGGAGGITWVVAGSVYKANKTTPSPNGIIYFWSDQGGTGELVATLEIDSLGNFFTNASILPGVGAYPQVRGTSGDIQTMPILAQVWDCNSCHGVSEDPIWIN